MKFTYQRKVENTFGGGSATPEETDEKQQSAGRHKYPQRAFELKQWIKTKAMD